jgi:hypothetical protein
MKRVSHKIMSMVLAFVVLCSTLTVAFNNHYCGGTLVETAVFQKAKGCGMEMQNPSSEGCALTKKHCCKDEIVVIDGQDELQLTYDTLTFEQHLFVDSFISVYSNLFEVLDRNVSTYQYYKPPRVIRQLYKLDETYLI